VSLILEALKKLEREKRSSEPGFLVLGPTSWPGAASGARRAVFALACLALLATALGLLAWRNAARPAPASTPAATVPAPAASFGKTAWLPPASTPAPESSLPVAETLAPEPIESEGAEPAPQATVLPSAAAPEAPRPRFRLQAISLRDGKPVAVLNDRLVYEGDSFDGISVVRIGDAEVELQVDGRRLVVGF